MRSGIFGGYFCWCVDSLIIICLMMLSALHALILCLCRFFLSYFAGETLVPFLLLRLFRGFHFCVLCVVRRFNHVAESAIMLLVDNDNC